MTLTGAELILRFLESQGIGRVAHIPGDSLLPLSRALLTADLAAIRHAGFRAEDYARDGHAGVCIVGSGPALNRAMGLLAEARAHGLPVVCIAGQVRRSLIDASTFREARDGRADAVTKAWFHVGAAAELVELLPAAFRIAQSGKPGPVVLEVPEDVQSELLEGAYVPALAGAAPPHPIARAEPALRLAGALS